MIKKWINFTESIDNVKFNNVDFGIPRFMLSNILIDLVDEFPGIYIDEMSISSFKSNYIGNGDDSFSDPNEFLSDLDIGGPKFAILIDKPNNSIDIYSFKETVYFLEPKIHEILDNIDGLLSQYNLRIWGKDFCNADTEYYIIVEKI